MVARGNSQHLWSAAPCSVSVSGLRVYQDLGPKPFVTMTEVDILLREGAEFMFIVTVVLFLLPCSLLWAAWRRSVRTTGETPTPSWRTYSGKAALVLAICSMLLELVFFYSWFHNGGSPHGLMPSPGIWKSVGRIPLWTFVGSIVLTAFGKGRWRIYIPVWAVSYVFVVYMIFALEMD
jgi:hypothetical protein